MVYQLYQVLLIYMVVVNVWTFALFGYDKWIAGGRVRRIPEKVLWFFCLVGGSVGGLVGMYTFRHKTRKASFQFGLVGILFVHTVLVLAWLFLL